MNNRKKTIVIEAFQYFDDMGTRTAVIPRWFIDATVSGTVYCKGKETFIKTPVAEHRLCDGDYVIHGEKGEIYPCKPDIFLLAYDSYTEAPSETTAEGHLPAFPTDNEHQSGPNTFHYSGITIRDYFAAAALTGLLGNHTNDTDPRGFVSDAYLYADEMIKRRSEVTK